LGFQNQYVLDAPQGASQVNSLKNKYEKYTYFKIYLLQMGFADYGILQIFMIVVEFYVFASIFIGFSENTARIRQVHYSIHSVYYFVHLCNSFNIQSIHRIPIHTSFH